jgi:hypothetical protein
MQYTQCPLQKKEYKPRTGPAIVLLMTPFGDDAEQRPGDIVWSYAMQSLRLWLLTLVSQTHPAKDILAEADRSNREQSNGLSGIGNTG